MEFPQGYAVFFGLDGKVIMTPQSQEHSDAIKRIQYSTIVSLGLDAKTSSDVYIDFPADENSAPDLAILREDAQLTSKRYSFEDVLLIAEVVSTSSVRKDGTPRHRLQPSPAPQVRHWEVADPPRGRSRVHSRPGRTGDRGSRELSF
jgi:hypothetical protein